MGIKDRIEYFLNVTWRNNRFSYVIFKGKNVVIKPKIIGMIRLRNESLVLNDTLDHLSGFVDGIVIYDDDSTDNSVNIALQHAKVIEVIKNKKWHRYNRAWEETANRKLLYYRAKKYKPDWFFYSDADERFEGNIRNYLINQCPEDVNGIRLALYDAYITSNDKEDYKSGQKLMNFRKYFGIERRDILMIWRNLPKIDFKNKDAREPQGVEGRIETKFFCQHYGKSISIQQWEETCKYYSENFPMYSEKWKARMGKAIHDRSDFETELKPWSDVKKSKTYI